MRLVEDRFEELTRFEQQGGTDQLNAIRTNAPRAIPDRAMRTLWELLLTRRVKVSHQGNSFFSWLPRFEREGLTTAVRLQLREVLTPRVELRKLMAPDKEHSESRTIADLVQGKIVLSMEDIAQFRLHQQKQDERWHAVLPALLPDFTMLLRDALDLMRELGGADKKKDDSPAYQPSISPHPQNHRFYDWTVLIELTRDAWLATAQESPKQAALVAEAWTHIPYPLFKRLAFFAAAHDGVIPPRRALDWLLADDHRWLWSDQTKRETIRLLVSLAPRLDETMLRELEQAILQGPPREMFENTIESERRTTFVDRGIWLRLAKVAATGVTLGGDAKKHLDDLLAQYPQWVLATDERDEFSVWMGDGSEWRTFLAAPRRRKELVEWLKQHPARDHWRADDWRQLCQDKFPTVVCALYTLAKEGVWPVDRWEEAFYAWSQKIHLKWSWRLLAPVLAEASDAQLQALPHPISYWLKQVARVFKEHEQRFFTLARRILDLSYEDHEGATTRRHG
ncbi:MAG: hypothetical protein NNA24_00615 [Nitrospira sp.]|nr:hypothetical protein [Nitrospira sp.]